MKDENIPSSSPVRERDIVKSIGEFLGNLTGHFNRIAIFCKIFVLAFLGFFMVSRGITNIVFDFFPLWGNPRGTTDALEFWNIIFLVVGILFCFFVLRRIFWPRIEIESFRPTLKINFKKWTLIMPNPVLRPMEFLFVTSHPLYFFLDILNVSVAWIFAYIGSYDSPFLDPTNNGVNYFCYLLFFWLTLSYAVFRQFSWYVLKRKVKVKERGIFIIKPLLTLYLILAFIGGLTAIIMVVDS